MFPGGHDAVDRSRLFAGARVRKALVYLLAAALALTAAFVGVKLATPPDPYGPIRVERLPGAESQEDQAKIEVSYDAETDRTTISRRSPDGTVRRYRVNKSDGEWRIEAEPETER
jgi:hypothetical protein